MTKIDSINARILQELSKDGRISNIDLADRVGLSPSACLRRTQELERSGVISGYRAVLNPDALGIGFVAYVAVGLSDHSKKSHKAFERSVVKSPEVRECHNTTGKSTQSQAMWSWDRRRTHARDSRLQTIYVLLGVIVQHTFGACAIQRISEKMLDGCIALHRFTDEIAVRAANRLGICKVDIDCFFGM